MNYPSERKSPVRLTPDEEWGIYKYCIENHCLKQVEDLTSFWVEPHKIAKEINEHFPKITNGRAISPQHIKGAVESVVGWQKRIGKLPVVPIETAELEQLRIFKKSAIIETENLKADKTQLMQLHDKLVKENERLKKPSDAHQKLERIRAIVSV